MLALYGMLFNAAILYITPFPSFQPVIHCYRVPHSPFRYQPWKKKHANEKIFVSIHYCNKQNATPTYISISLEHFFATLLAKGEGTKVQVINQYTPLTFHLTHFAWFLLWEYCRPFVDNEASSIPPSFFHSHIRHLHSQMYQGWINTGILSC